MRVGMIDGETVRRLRAQSVGRALRIDRAALILAGEVDLPHEVIAAGLLEMVHLERTQDTGGEVARKVARIKAQRQEGTR